MRLQLDRVRTLLGAFLNLDLAGFRQRQDFLGVTLRHRPLCAVRATLDIIHNAVTENPAADALYGMLFTLDGIANDLCAAMEGERV